MRNPVSALTPQTVFAHSHAGGAQAASRSHPACTRRAFSSLASVTKPQAAAAEGGKEGVSMEAEQGRRKEGSTRVVSPSTALKTLQKREQREEAQRGAPASSPGDIAGAVRCIS